mgnify:CR=1 FL=1
MQWPVCERLPVGVRLREIEKCKYSVARLDAIQTDMKEAAEKPHRQEEFSG